MKVSEAIQDLLDILDEHGDVDISIDTHRGADSRLQPMRITWSTEHNQATIDVAPNPLSSFFNKGYAYAPYVPLYFEPPTEEDEG